MHRSTSGLGSEPVLRLSMLGSFGLSCDAIRVPLPGTSQRLLAFLALQRRPLPRIYVAGTLWPDTTERHASGNLRTALWRLNGLSASVVVTLGNCLALDPAVEVDLHQAVSLAQGLMSGETACREVPIASLTLATELLPGWYDDWVAPERESFREMRLHALEHLCRELAAAERFGDAIEAGLAAVAGDPLRESSHRALIRAYLLEGNLALALRQYRQCREVLEDELGVEPSSRMASLLSEHGLAGAAMRQGFERAAAPA